MPVYKYFGYPARFHGKPLFHILCHLKEFGKGRVLVRSSHEVEPTHTKQPSFYRILWAQPLMDKHTLEGRIVAERVRHGVRYQEPVDLADIAPLPDFKLIPREEEAEVCRWDSLRPFSAEEDTVAEPAHFTCPPLLRMLMERSMKERGEEITSDALLLPHNRTYVPRDTETVEVGDSQAPGRKSREKPRLVKHQELPTRCEGTASYQYTEAVAEKYRPKEGENVLERLPEEGPMPQPAVGMRLSKWPDTFRNPKDELRTEEHNSFRP